MIGCRSLSDGEIARLLTVLVSQHHKNVSARVACQIIVMATTGMRIGENCCLRVGDVSRAGLVADEIYSQARYRKGHKISWRYPLSATAAGSLDHWLDYSGLRAAPPQAWLYPPARGSTDRPYFYTERHVSDKAVRKLLDELCRAGGITGHVSCHSFRKTFAARVYEKTGNNILATQRALGHEQLQSTLHYLDVRDAELTGILRNLF
jgi:integrase